MSETTRIIEIEGVKVEVDLRKAKNIDAFKVGDKVKVLTKNYSGYKSSPGVIVGFDCFTIVVAYLNDPLSYEGNGGKVEFAYLNAESKDVELCPMLDDDIIPTKATMIEYFDRAIQKSLKQVEAITERKEYFLRRYGAAFAIDKKDMAAESPAEF